MISRRHFLRFFAGLGAAGVSTAAYGFGEPLLRLRVARYDIRPRQWPADFHLKIAVIADLHACDPWMPLPRIEVIVERTNALHADIIVMLGDYVAGHRHLTRLIPAGEWAPVLAGLRAPLGVHAILGNHDWWDDRTVQREGEGLTVARQALEAAGIPVYENDVARLTKVGRPFWLAGLGDQLAYVPARRFRPLKRVGVDDLAATLAKVTDDAPLILLAHEPDVAMRVPARVALQLSGHTHGGQVRLFGWSPAAPSGNKLAYGHVHINCDVVVSGGLGCSYLPFPARRPAGNRAGDAGRIKSGGINVKPATAPAGRGAPFEPDLPHDALTTDVARPSLARLVGLLRECRNMDSTEIAKVLAFMAAAPELPTPDDTETFFNTMPVAELASMWGVLQRLSRRDLTSSPGAWAASLYFDHLPHKYPDRALDLALEVLRSETDKATVMELNNRLLPALVFVHGQAVIGRIESEAQDNARLRWLVGGIHVGPDHPIQHRIAEFADIEGWQADDKARSTPADPLDCETMSLNELARAWIEQLSKSDRDRDDNFFTLMEYESDLLDEDPDKAIDLILEILKLETNPGMLALLAAGPLEDVISMATIDRIEREAAANKRFHDLLGGVWYYRASDALKARLDALVGENRW